MLPAIYLLAYSSQYVMAIGRQTDVHLCESVLFQFVWVEWLFVRIGFCLKNYYFNLDWWNVDLCASDCANLSCLKLFRSY